MERVYGHRAMTAAELVAHRDADRAEGVDPRDLTEGDYEWSRRRMQALSGVRVPRVPRCLPDAVGAAPCEPARFRGRGEPQPQWMPPPRVTVEPLPAVPERRPWSTWAPRLGSIDASSPDILTPTRAAELGADAAEDVFDAGLLAGFQVDDPLLLFHANLSEAEDTLPRAAAFARFVGAVGRVPARARPGLRAAFEDGFEAALWSHCLAAAPSEDTARPGNEDRRPWSRLFGA